MYVMEPRSFFFVHGLGVCMFVWVCGCMTVFFVWAWRRWSVGSGLGCCRGVRCAGVVVLGGGAVGAGLGSAGSRCWDRAGGAAFGRVHWPFPAPGFRGVGLGLRFAVVSAWRCLRVAFLAVAGLWFCGFPVLGSVGERGLYLCVYACKRMLIFCVLAGWRVVEADSIIPPSLFSQAAPLGAAAPLSFLSLPLSPVPGASTSRWPARLVCHPCTAPPPRAHPATGSA